MHPAIYSTTLTLTFTHIREDKMGIFTRFRDIVSSNINSMLDGAENPEKMIKLMIREMEDTLIELKASCASVIASSKKIQRRQTEILAKENLWKERAELAVSKGKDNLAREALIERRRFSELSESVEKELSDHTSLINQYREDIGELESKLQSAQEKKRSLIQRHKRATNKKRAHTEMRQADSAESMARFEQMESRIEQMEAEADLVNVKKKTTLADEFAELDADEEIEKELEKIKSANYSSEETK